VNGLIEFHFERLYSIYMNKCTSSIKSTIICLSSLGYYEFYLNDNKVNPSRKLDPGWTTSEQRTLIMVTIIFFLSKFIELFLLRMV
jgi:hypothetical protein